MRNVESLKVIIFTSVLQAGGTESKVIYERNCLSALHLQEKYFQQI